MENYKKIQGEEGQVGFYPNEDTKVYYDLYRENDVLRSGTRERHTVVVEDHPVCFFRYFYDSKEDAEADVEKITNFFKCSCSEAIVLYDVSFDEE